MARYKPVGRHLMKLLPVRFSEQILPGTFEYAVHWLVDHPRTTAMKIRIDTREGRLLYSRRLGIVEPVFGNLHNHRLRRFTLRSRRKVDAQWKLFALVHNVQKLQGRPL